MEAGCFFTAENSMVGMAVEIGQGLADIFQQQFSRIAADTMAHRNPLHRLLLAVGCQQWAANV